LFDFEAPFVSGIASTNIASHALFFTNQIEVAFVDDIGNPRDILGTGFWVEKEGSHYFVTNRHNVDPSMMKRGENTGLCLHNLKIKLRRKVDDNWSHETAACEVEFHGNIEKHESADVAVIKNPTFINNQREFTYGCFSLGDIAGELFFIDYLNVMGNASFIGFPGNKGRPWYDDSWNLAIARTVNIASHPAIPFSNKDIKTSDVMLVSGLSFSGSSGSPVLSHKQLGVAAVPELTGVHEPSQWQGCLNRTIRAINNNITYPKLIGIMSGHWDEEADSDVFRHSGLSYLTRSTAILEMLN
jgi:hypothetical protein